MLLLNLNIGKEHYAIRASQVIEIIPSIQLEKVPLVESSIKGIFNYRGNPTPVIDLCELFENRSCNKNLSSRIIIIDYKTDKNESRPVGLIAESVTDVTQCNQQDIESSGISSLENPFLGDIYKHNNEIIQLIDTHKVLPHSISSQLITRPSQ